ncbi:MAG: formylglycine-generating enzyme family protein [Acidobacteria bacterium]|nr:formylglycine-generating enzyme family protein [Acidobacteriota bacterium]
MIDVSWEDARAYAEWLSAETGERYRLPSEAEWEYAARAGTTTAYSWGADIGQNRANCDGCGSRWDNEQTAPAGSFAANAWGLHDMHGNVWEWVEDCWHDSYAQAPADGSAWTRGGDCGRRVLRGGSWYLNPWGLRSALRSWFGVRGRYRDVGFRLARTLTP